MPWDPDKYNEFKSERYQPFYDLLSHIKDRPGLKVLDLGCGTGELTNFLADKLTDPIILGIDNSAEMLSKAPAQPNLQFKLKSIEDQLQEDTNWDIIFANASLQWVDDHPSIINLMIAKLDPGGQLAVQMPCQEENILNQVLLKLIQEEPFASALSNWKRISPLLSIDEYAELLFKKSGKEITIYQKMYPVIADSHDQLFNFISGSALVPYMERLPEDLQKQLSALFRERIKKQFPELPAIYAFKRLIIYSVF